MHKYISYICHFIVTNMITNFDLTNQIKFGGFHQVRNCRKVLDFGLETVYFSKMPISHSNTYSKIKIGNF